MKIIADPQLYREKEALYIDVRNAEGRVISDELLKTLPYAPSGFTYKAEWDIRAKNFELLAKHIDNVFTGNKVNILDIGCGNGWMSHNLASKGHLVTGLDLNLTELEQAEKVFGENTNLRWVYADILNDIIEGKYDLILFSASCQYFPNIKELISKLLPLLNESGEIHLHDSIFYKEEELAPAAQRSKDYYNSLGFPSMSAYYFHHSKNVLKQLNFRQMNPPGLFRKKQALEWWMKNNS